MAPRVMMARFFFFLSLSLLMLSALLVLPELVVGQTQEFTNKYTRKLQETCVLAGNLYGTFEGNFRNIDFFYQAVFAEGTSPPQVSINILPSIEQDLVQGILPDFFNCPGNEPTDLINGISPSDADELTTTDTCYSQAEGVCYTVSGSIFVFGNLANDREAEDLVLPALQRYMQSRLDWTNIDSRLLDIVYVIVQDGQIVLPPLPPVVETSFPTVAPTPVRRLSVAQITAQTFVLRSFEALIGLGGVTSEISGDGPYTIFLPWDYAMQKLPMGWFDKLRQRGWGAHLRNLLLYHVFYGNLPLDDDLAETQTLVMANGETVIVSRRSGTLRVCVNDILVLATYDASNGFAYMLDEVLLPSWFSLSLFDIASMSTNAVSTLTELVLLAGLESDLSDPNESFTIFAPSNDAFAKLDQTALTYLTSEEGLVHLQDILRYHIVPGPPFPFGSFFGTTDSILTTLQGETVELIPGEPVSVNGVSNGARITAYDQLANNGLIHIIDTVLLLGSVPPTALPTLVPSLPSFI